MPPLPYLVMLLAVIIAAGITVLLLIQLGIVLTALTTVVGLTAALLFIWLRK
ncbi:hypothetical protein GGR95_001595 [Sulfitobacter undariae]|uniref:Uncharacterized protein n=1 Tax=Sulfitobacter undariae TaxID=1563671 RepID=A0A7W6H1P4_9RHOB|nr:hypothetical protein [Sulfitobacter undariae]MBB3993964.1 hypothetical protein [Sulfitobacter undariae]